ncbi:MAG: exodeoxyribonuclease gamma chain RecC, partial [Pseudomonadota bacterium]
MAGLFVHRAGRAEASAAALADVLRAGASDDPIHPVAVAVGSRGMERWLRHRLARLLGVVANLSFPFPAALLAEALGMSAADAAWRPEAMTWRVLRWLDDGSDTSPGAGGPTPMDVAARRDAAEGTPERAPLMRWLETRRVTAGADGTRMPHGVIDRDRYTLARELADILDRVALFRPTWTIGFERHEALDADALPHDPRFAWLAPAWRAVADGVGPPPPRQLALAKPAPGAPLHIFGVVSMPPLWWQAWARVAEVRDVHLFPILPTDAYIGDHRTRAELRRASRRDAATPSGAGERVQTWTEVAEQHPLLTALGRTTRDAVEAYLDAEAHEIDVVDPSAEEGGESVDGEGDRLLAWLQRDLREAVGGETLASRRAERRWSPADDSLEVHGCHGPTRQVEVLRDVLLRLFQQHPHLEPRDVLILTP